MKVILYSVIDMETGETKYEESIDYDGPVALCGGSSGGSSGTVDFPQYMKDVHANWLYGSTSGISTTVSASITEIIDAAQGNSPFTSLSAYDPSTAITNYETAISDFATILGGLDDEVDWDSFYTQATSSMAAPTTVPPLSAVGDVPDPTDVSDITDTTDVSTITDAAIDADSDSLGDLLDDEITTKVLPRFRGGMRDANASANAAFPIGEAIIEAFKIRDVAKHNSALRVQAAIKNVDVNVKNEELHLDVRKTNSTIQIENERLQHDAEKVNMEKDLRIEEGNAKVSVANKQNATQFEQLKIGSTELMANMMKNRIGWEQSYTQFVIEGKRIAIVANKEQTDMDMKIDEKDALWDLSIWKAGVNVMASISGATVSQGDEPSVLQSALGGALSGAAAGASIGGPVGAGIGAVAGAAMSLL